MNAAQWKSLAALIARTRKQCERSCHPACLPMQALATLLETVCKREQKLARRPAQKMRG